MVKKILALCDKEKNYLYHLAAYLEEKNRLPFVIHIFTDYSQLDRFLAANEVEILLIAESVFREEVLKHSIKQTLILNESGMAVGEQLQNINKYQSSENIFRRLMDGYMESAGELPQRLTGEGKMKIIGFYTPIGRCLQTTFALSMGQLLAGKSRVLYMDMDSCSGLSQLLYQEQESDITDVLYFFSCEKEKLSYRLSGIVQNINGMDYIPSSQSLEDIHSVSKEQWLQLLEEIGRTTEYEYLILDLTEQIDGLLEILKTCFRIFTIIRQDEHSLARIKRYEASLQTGGYEEIAIKTSRQKLPLFHRVSLDPRQLLQGEVAAYVRRVIEEEVEKDDEK